MGCCCCRRWWPPPLLPGTGAQAASRPPAVLLRGRHCTGCCQHLQAQHQQLQQEELQGPKQQTQVQQLGPPAQEQQQQQQVGRGLAQAAACPALRAAGGRRVGCRAGLCHPRITWCRGVPCSTAPPSAARRGCLPHVGGGGGEWECQGNGGTGGGMRGCLAVMMRLQAQVAHAHLLLCPSWCSRGPGGNHCLHVSFNGITQVSGKCH